MKEKERKNIVGRGSACKDKETGPTVAHRKEEGGWHIWLTGMWELVSLRQVIRETRMRWA